MARVLIAGMGYLGARVAGELVSAGHEVFGLSRTPMNVSSVRAIAADLTEPDSLRTLPGGFDCVFYTTSASPHDLIRALEEESSELQRFLFVSSTGVYERDDGGWVDETSRTGPSRDSARRLLEGERAVAAASWPSVVLRLSGIYGPGRGYWLGRVLAGERCFAIDPGEITNGIHVDDAARALVHLMTLENPESVYIGSDSEPVEKRALVRWLCRQLTGEEPSFVKRAPGTPVRGNKRCSNRRLLASGFSLRYPTFREGYRALMEKQCC